MKVDISGNEILGICIHTWKRSHKMGQSVLNRVKVCVSKTDVFDPRIGDVVPY